MKAKNNFKNFILALYILLFSTCANQLPPGGGEVDRIPPEIIETFPEDETINFDGDFFEIGFSEYVDKRSVQDAVFISPAIDGEIEYDWSGKYLRIYFPAKLKENTTYVVTVGTDVADLNNKNRMVVARTFTFSTGNVIDRRIITGKVYDPKAEDVMIFAYKLSDTTTNPLAYKPDYISQSGKKGDYSLMGLAAGKYRIFAVQDEYRDFLFQSEQDKIGIPFSDVFLAADDSLYAGLDFFLTSADTISPRFVSAVMTDEYHILINLSKNFDSTIVHTGNFTFIDSATGRITKPLFAFKGNTKPTEFVLVISERFPDSDQLFVIADTLRDKKGNLYSGDFTSITTSEAPDTTKPQIVKAIPSSGNRESDYQNQTFTIFFDDAFRSDIAGTGITFKDTIGREVEYSLSFIDDASFKVIPEQRLDPQRDYLIEIDLAKFKDAAGNSYDSVYQYRFRTIRGLDFTGVSGVITNTDFSKNPRLVLTDTNKEGKTYMKSVNDRNFSFERIIAGKYILWCFYDTDSTGYYSYGFPGPFTYSEEFFFYPDTLILKARWTMTDINFVLKEREK